MLHEQPPLGEPAGVGPHRTQRLAPRPLPYRRSARSMSLDDAANAVDIEEARTRDEEINPLQMNGPQPSQMSAPLPPLAPPRNARTPRRCLNPSSRAWGVSPHGQGLRWRPCRCSAAGSAIFEETTLEALDQEPKDLHALADDVLGLPGTDRNASCPNGKPALFLRQLSGSTTCSSSATQGSSTTTSQGSAKGDTSAPAVAPLTVRPRGRRPPVKPARG